ncbi:gamma-secretase subunit Aph-1-like [Diadema antillarum]|uniref:gamma-secretase subunit Aph-1-like n=1 Tax=Diadema antillarum TaxID=105358 RepID=UPI003A872EA2
MTLMQLFGAMFIAYSPAVALFIFTIAKEPLRIIVMMAGMFFWLVSLLTSSILWFAVVPLRDKVAFGLTFSIFFQELFRFLYYKLLRKAEDGLQQFNQTSPEQSQHGNGGASTSDKARHGYAYVAGLGFGVMSGIFSFINVLADSKGPGTVGIYNTPQDFLITSAFLTMCFILLHVMWNVIFYWSFESRRYWAALLVVASHFLVSELTLLNRDQYYNITLPVAYATLAIMSLFAFCIAGGSLRSIKAACTFQRSRYAL